MVYIARNVVGVVRAVRAGTQQRPVDGRQPAEKSGTAVRADRVAQPAPCKAKRHDPPSVIPAWFHWTAAASDQELLR